MHQLIIYVPSLGEPTIAYTGRFDTVTHALSYYAAYCRVHGMRPATCREIGNNFNLAWEVNIGVAG